MDGLTDSRHKSVRVYSKRQLPLYHQEEMASKKRKGDAQVTWDAKTRAQRRVAEMDEEERQAMLLQLLADAQNQEEDKDQPEKSGLVRRDSNGDFRDNQEKANYSSWFPPTLPKLTIDDADLKFREPLINRNPPNKHELVEEHGVLYRGVPIPDNSSIWDKFPPVNEKDLIWKEVHNRHHRLVMLERIQFEHNSKGDGSDGSLASKQFPISPANLEKVQESTILRLLRNKWPLTDRIGQDWKIPVGTDLKGKAIVYPCIQCSSTSKVLSRGSCFCGSVFASIAKGMHENSDNDLLKLDSITPIVVEMDNFRKLILGKEGSVQTKQLLCYYLRLFVHTNVSGLEKSKMALIGSDQRCSILNRSYGCPRGPIALCLDFQKFLFGEWTTSTMSMWGDSATLDEVNQELPPVSREEKRFTQFIRGCLQHPMEKKIQSTKKTYTTKIHSSDGKIKLCLWMNGKLGENTQEEQMQREKKGEG